MDTNHKAIQINSTVVRVILILLALVAFVLAAGAPICIAC